jgi:hypothetical protein
MKIKAKLLGLAAVAALGAGLAAAPAQALIVEVAGKWAANATLTEYSVPGESFLFTFDIPATYSTTYQDSVLSVTTDFSNYHYDLGGVPVAGNPDNIAFFDASQGGGLALGYFDHSVEIFGPDIGSAGTLTPGIYAGAFPNIDDAKAAGSPIDMGQGPTTLTVSAVPEPTSWAVMLLGVAGLGGAVRAARRRTLAA